MRIRVCAVVLALGLAPCPVFAQVEPAGAFWKAVQARCDATAARPPSELGRRIAQTAIDEFNGFGGHRIDATGRLFDFGLTDAQHLKDAGGRQSRLGQLGWWHVVKYWRALYGDDFASKLEVRGYETASTEAEGERSAALIRSTPAELMRALDAITDPAQKEILREAALRSAIVDTPWSAAFVSYVIKQAGVTADAFQFSNAHRAYIYDAFATSAAEQRNEAGGNIYRACPITSTRPRAGDLICHQREPTLAHDTASAVRERIRGEVAGKSAMSVRRTHCDVVVAVDARAHKMYSISGNIYHSVTARKLKLRRDMKFSAAQTTRCGGSGHWTLARAAGAQAGRDDCSLNERKWFVLLQLR